MTDDIMDRYRRAVAALRRSMIRPPSASAPRHAQGRGGMSAWKPISEAPRYMREIVLGHWTTASDGKGRAWESAVGFRHGTNFSTLESDMHSNFLRRGAPTHFIDLPVPPSDEPKP